MNIFVCFLFLFSEESRTHVVTVGITELGSLFNLDLTSNCKLDVSVYISKYSIIWWLGF